MNWNVDMHRVPHRERAVVAELIRRHCTPDAEAYRLGGDTLVLAVADWVEHPPPWVLERYGDETLDEDRLADIVDEAGGDSADEFALDYAAKILSAAGVSVLREE